MDIRWTRMKNGMNGIAILRIFYRYEEFLAVFRLNDTRWTFTSNFYAVIYIPKVLLPSNGGGGVLITKDLDNVPAVT